MRLRDRDAIITEDNFIFRVYGYFHPFDAYVCDPEYAPTSIYQTVNPKAPRGTGKPTHYKFYAHEGLQLIQRKYPRYTIFYEPLQERLVGVQGEHIAKTRKPENAFGQLITKHPEDDLLKSLHSLSELVISSSRLSEKDFGVFGSLLHGFYHHKFSDLDLIVYGGEKLKSLCDTLQNLYQEESSIRNEFESEKALEGKAWRFVNYDPKEYLWHQRRKLIYAIFESGGRRITKVEFEPVKTWKEITNEYNPSTRILKRGWTKAVARITDDKEAPFIPSTYSIQTLEILEGPKVTNIRRILSYVEEFRMQAQRDELVHVEGKLEEVVTKTQTFHQIALTYGPRYYDQTLKVIA